MSEFDTLVSQQDIDLVCMSESWEREHLTLDKIITMDNYTIISNVHQRKGKGGRPAIIANHKKFSVQNITQSLVNIPWGVEIVWAILTPKNLSNDSVIKKIVVASIYSKPDSRKKSILLDHISETYNLLCSMYNDGLHFILAGDTNDLKLDAILNLCSNMRQVVQSPTRLSPPAMLDPILTTLSKFYQVPVCIPPLDPDPDSDGSPSDHLMVLMHPISTLNNKSARTKRSVTFRPLPESGLRLFGDWLSQHPWDNVYNDESAHNKAQTFQSDLLDALNHFLPEKTVNFSSDDQPWCNPAIKDLDRKCKREYNKHRKSKRWKYLNTKFEQMCSNAKSNYYRNIVEDLKTSNPGQWYSKLKRLSSHNQQQSEIEELTGMTDSQQAEAIADHYANVANKFSPLKDQDVTLPEIPEGSVPHIDPNDVFENLC